LGFSLVSQGVSKTINILADSFDRLNGASLYGDATTDQAGAANRIGWWRAANARLISDNDEKTWKWFRTSIWVTLSVLSANCGSSGGIG
jgi:hypothetical protein